MHEYDYHKTSYDNQSENNTQNLYYNGNRDKNSHKYIYSMLIISIQIFNLFLYQIYLTFY